MHHAPDFNTRSMGCPSILYIDFAPVLLTFNVNTFSVSKGILALTTTPSNNVNTFTLNANAVAVPVAMPCDLIFLSVADSFSRAASRATSGDMPKLFAISLFI